MRPLHVFHVLFRFGIGGLENGIVNLVNGLDPARYRHSIVCLADYDPTYLERVRNRDLEIHALHKRPGQDPQVWRKLWGLLRKIRPDVLHTRNFVALEYQMLGVATGVRGRVHGEHGWDVHDLDGNNRRHRLARRVFALGVHRFIALSRHLADYLVTDAGVAPSKVVQIYNGVDLERFGPRSAPSTGAPLVIGTVGRMKAVKNQTLLCQAFLDLVAQRPDLRGRVRLRMIGDGPLREECAAMARQAGAADLVELPGDSDRVADDMRDMDIFVLPSLAEGVSNTILEAMASGLPVIASDVGGNPELVAEGVTGTLFPVEARAGLSAAMARYVDDDRLRRAHGAAGRAAVIANFGMPNMLAAYDRVYQTLAAPR